MTGMIINDSSLLKGQQWSCAYFPSRGWDSLVLLRLYWDWIRAYIFHRPLDKKLWKILWQYFSGTFSTNSCHTTSNITNRNNLYSVWPLNSPENQLCICNSGTDVRKSNRGCPDNGPVICSMSKLFHHSHVRGCLNQLQWLNVCQKKFYQFIFFFTKDLLKRNFSYNFQAPIVLFQECPKIFQIKCTSITKLKICRQIRSWNILEIPGSQLLWHDTTVVTTQLMKKSYLLARLFSGALSITYFKGIPYFTFGQKNLLTADM